MERSQGIAVFQFWGRAAAFFTTFVNPIGLDNIEWKWLIVYCVFLVYEIIFVWYFVSYSCLSLPRDLVLGSPR
jgi:hypothetical protein